jgi:predicted Rossmann fold nucleotide-binding protein DprA/Smf involved in DNA uptake
MDKWLRAGIWVVTRSDKEYPIRLKQRLGVTSPALFFGSGKRALLNKAGIAVVGSRNADDQDLDFSRQLGATTAEQGYSIVSGAARGVDEAAMSGALEAEGIAVGIVADSLLRKAGSPRFRKYLQSGDLALISPFFPEAGFNVGNAMARNKYIYCLSEAAVVVHSGTKGGTWGGAHEAIKKGWVPVWVKETGDKKAGNDLIVKAGGGLLSAEAASLELSSLFGEILPEQEPRTVSAPLFQANLEGSKVVEEGGPLDSPKLAPQEPEGELEGELCAVSPDLDFYQLFFHRARQLCEKRPRTIEQLVKDLQILDEQLKEWLVPALDEGKLVKDDGPKAVLTVGGPVSPDQRFETLEVLEFYELFLLKIQHCCKGEPRNADSLSKLFQVARPQLNKWAKQAVRDGFIRRSINPVRYEWIAQDSKQLKMFRTEMPQEKDRAESPG